MSRPMAQRSAANHTKRFSAVLYCEEKLRSEAATYIWMREHCPDVPVPMLRGFGVPGGLSVSLDTLESSVLFSA